MESDVDYVCTRDAAQELGISRRTLQRHIKEGKVEVTRRAGKSALIARRELARYLEAGATEGQSARAQIASLRAHVAALERRLRTLEALLDISAPHKVSLDTDQVQLLRDALITALTHKKRWGIAEISTMLGDIGKLSLDTVEAVGKSLVCSALDRVRTEARLLRHSRSEIYIGRALLIGREIGAPSEEEAHLASDW